MLCQQPDPTVLGSLKLSDFGFSARFEERSTECFDDVCGTLEYMAPELARNFKVHAANQRGRANFGRGAPKYGAAIDVWALGCMVYEIFHGEPPFFHRDDETQLHRVLRHQLAFPPASFAAAGVSASGIELIRAMLDPDPSAVTGHHGMNATAECRGWLAPAECRSWLA